MAGELAHLQTATPADLPAKVRATIEADLGRPLHDLFAQFNEEPLASASIAQVHVARLHSGEHVVVKVQHDGIEDRIVSDLDILADLAKLAERYASDLRSYQPEAVVRQFRRTLLRELDFTFERRNLEEFAKNFSQDDTVHFPRAFAPFSTRRVLTMEKLDGILGTHPEALANSGVDLEEVAQRGATMYLEMIFRDAFYHADPHPGNLMLLPGGVIGVLTAVWSDASMRKSRKASTTCSLPSRTAIPWTWRTRFFASAPRRPLRPATSCAPISPISSPTTSASPSRT
jgi:ubiquinone biosynthesis protein